jgi:hypothetical protein
MKRLLILIVVLIGFSQPLRAAGACCSVTAIDARTGTATAVETATSRTFEFHIPNAKLFATLRVGTPVYANFSTMQVSLDGKTPCGAITQINPAPARGGVGAVGRVAPPASAAPSAPAPAAAPAPTAAPPPASAPVARPAPGAPPAAAPTATSTPAAAHAAVLPQSVAGKLSGNLPPLTYGTPQSISVQDIHPMAPPSAGRATQRSIGGVTIAHVRGVDGLEQAQVIPKEITNLLGIHVRALPAGESDHYMINVEQAKIWLVTHPIPDTVKAADVKTGDGHSGCKAISWHCAEESAKHAEDEASRQAELVRDQAQKDWKKYGKELTDTWREGLSCLEDHTLRLDNIPVEFAASPSVGIHLEKSGKTTLSNNGSASGKAEGTVNLALPMKSPDFRANLEVFYIPCLPFMVRPKSISGHGTLTVGSKLTAAVKATGQFEETIPTGSTQIPIQVIPIVLGGIPIVELDIDAYVEGNIEVGGEGEFTANFELDNPHEMKLEFSCSGHGCAGRSQPVAVPTTAAESAQLNGRIHVKPMVFTAIQLGLDFDALVARAGPQPYLFGEVYGCVAGAATQNLSSGTSTAQDWYALTADLDWGIDLRAEAFIAGKKVGPTLMSRLVSQNPPKHIGFWDLAHSTALLPQVQGLTQASLGQPAVYQIKMPTCYPYPDKVKYQLAWTGSAIASIGASGATAAARSMVRPDPALKLAGNGTPPPSTGPPSPCNLQSGQGSCEFDPVKNFALDLLWPAAGTYNLTVTAVGDTPHGRQYKSAQPTTLNVTVQ